MLSAKWWPFCLPQCVERRQNSGSREHNSGDVRPYRMDRRDGLHFDHCSDVIMNTMASQITSLTIVYSTVYSGADQRKHQSSALLALCSGYSLVTGEFPAQRASNAENVSVWWNHVSRNCVISITLQCCHMSIMKSQITGDSTVCSIACSG